MTARAMSQEGPRHPAAPIRLRGSLRGLPLTRLDEDCLVLWVNEGGGLKTSGRRYRAHEVLGMKRQAFESHLNSVTEKLGAQSRTHAAALAFARLGHRYLESDERRRLLRVALELLNTSASRSAHVIPTDGRLSSPAPVALTSSRNPGRTRTPNRQLVPA